MPTNSRKPTQKSRLKLPSLRRGPYEKALIKVAVPPEVAKWQRGGAYNVPYKQITQERAIEITGKSVHTVRRWASGRQEIDVTSLRLLQVWVWGIIPGKEFIDAGIFLIYDSYRYVKPGKGKPETLIATDNGYFIKAGDLQSFGWLQGVYMDHLRAMDKARAAEKEAAETAAKPSAKIILFDAYLTRRHPPTTDKEKA